MNIFTVFSGRRNNIEIQKKYLTKALELNIIDEVHYWNNTRNSADEEYLKSISNLKRTSSASSGNYVLINPVINNNSFEIDIKAPNDIHVKISDLETEYEIVLGAYNNTKFIMRENNKEIFLLDQYNLGDIHNYINYTFFISNDKLIIKKNNAFLIQHAIKNNFIIKNIYFKTGFGSVGDLKFIPTKNKFFYFMDTCEKSWKNYYNYYDNKKYENDIILKVDDDIVFIDLCKLPKFIDFVKCNNYDLVFANIINNGVSAYFQQNKYNLIPKDLMNLEYPLNGLKGSLWESGEKAELLHNYFIENYKKFIDYEYNNETIPITTRFSINFFAYKGKNWYKIKDCYVDDERNLTVDYVANRSFTNIFYTDLYVSHLSFYRQNETGINIDKLIEKYNELYNVMEENGRFLLK